MLGAGLAVDPKVQNTGLDEGLTGLLAKIQDWVAGLTWQSRWRGHRDNTRDKREGKTPGNMRITLRLWSNHNILQHSTSVAGVLTSLDFFPSPNTLEVGAFVPEILILLTSHFDCLFFLLILPPSVRCAVISTAKGQHKYNYQCGIMEGRFVHVVLPELQKNLTICEVQVYSAMLSKLHKMK